MLQALGSGLLALLVVAFVVIAWRSVRRRRIGPGAAGAVYDLLNEDKRSAIEIILEERTAYRDPEDPDGNLPDLESPLRKPAGRDSDPPR